MYEVMLGMILIAVFIVLFFLVVHSLTDAREQKKLQQETYEELQRREAAYKRYKETKEKANEQKKELHEGTTADQFDHSIDIMHNLSRKDHH